MRNQNPRDAAASQLFQFLNAAGSAQEIEQKLMLLRDFRSNSPEGGAQVDRMLLEEIVRMRSGLESARMSHEDLRKLAEALTAPPLFPAIFQGRSASGSGLSALVRVPGELRAVGFGENDPDEFVPGDEVLLSNERNFIHCKAQPGSFTCGDTASFVRRDGGRHLVVKSRDEDMVVLAGASLRDAELKAGDLLRFDRTMWVAHERIERPRGDEFFLEETPIETFDSIGGLDHEIGELKRSIELHFYHPEIVRKYRLRRKKAILLHGPPGTGKTLIARALANWMARLSKSGRSRFINVKPGGLHSMWYGQTQANYREMFRVAREAGASEAEVPVMVFFDEVDAIGGVRGRSVHQIDDSVLNAFMAELQGLEDRGNIIVVAATNRLDALDSALTRPGRLGDLLLRVPRPNRKAARQIFEKHLLTEIPYATNGHPADRMRTDLIDTAVSMIFSASGDSELAQVMFRDGKRRTVWAGDLINGAEIASITLAATERACAREARGAPGGIQLADMADAVSDFLASAGRALTPHNCRNYLDDLPQDVDVVRVDQTVRKVSKPHRYFNAA